MPLDPPSTSPNESSVNSEAQNPQVSDTHPVSIAQVPDQLKVRRIQTRWDADKKGYVTREEETEPQKANNEEVTCDISIVRSFVQQPFREDVKDEIHIHSPMLISIVKTILKSNELLNLQTSSTVKVRFDQLLVVLLNDTHYLI
jgi:hypothetical protein